MTTDRTANRRRFVLAGFAAGIVATVVRPVRAFAQAIKPMIEHPFARAN